MQSCIYGCYLLTLFIFGARNFHSRLIWSEKSPPKTGARKCSRFVAPVSAMCDMGLRVR